ncbi:hypothetical protein RAA17_20110 [Komagataeibacter rhaeticus]|nr:hypothetical protein [Komagataeibacter rhaeticus]
MMKTRLRTPRDEYAPAFPAGLRKLLGTITRRTGLHYYTDKTDLLEDMVGARMRLHGCRTCHDYLAMLADGARGTRNGGNWSPS